jgi:hypothetical protein
MRILATKHIRIRAYLLLQIPVIPDNDHPVAQVAQVAAHALVFGFDFGLVVDTAIAEDASAGICVVEVGMSRVVG